MDLQSHHPLTLTLSPEGRGDDVAVASIGAGPESDSTFPLPCGERAFRRDLASKASQVAWRKG
jgi:hypothetical protein